MIDYEQYRYNLMQPNFSYNNIHSSDRVILVSKERKEERINDNQNENVTVNV
jgi:hypothetical protein